MTRRITEPHWSRSVGRVDDQGNVVISEHFANVMRALVKQLRLTDATAEAAAEAASEAAADAAAPADITIEGTNGVEVFGSAEAGFVIQGPFPPDEQRLTLIPGRDGVDGEDAWPIPGPQGPQGIPGLFVVGMDGADGEDGWRGPPGADGAAGAAGAAGSAGPPGMDGIDAEAWPFPDGGAAQLAAANVFSNENFFSSFAAAKRAIVARFGHATPTVDLIRGEMSDGTRCFSWQSDGGLIVDQRTGATFTKMLDVKYQGTTYGFVDTTGIGCNGDLSFQAVANAVSFAGNLTVSSSAANLVNYGTTKGAGTAVSRAEFNKKTTGIANATATDVLTITIPNAAHSGQLYIELCGSLGAGGAIGANEATATNCYSVTFTRTAGVNAVATLSAASGASACAVAGAATVTCTATLSAVSGAVGAANTFTIKATISRSGGASTNHTCLVYAKLMNSNATGITLS